MSDTCITCKTWKRRGSELIGVCSHPKSDCNADHPSNAETRKRLAYSGEDFRQFFWAGEDYGCDLYSRRNILIDILEDCQWWAEKIINFGRNPVEPEWSIDAGKD